MNTLFLETNRLLLKFSTRDDLPALLKLRTNPEVMRYIGNGNIQTQNQVEEFLTLAIGYQERYGIDFCSVFEKNTNQFIGQAGLFHLGFDETQKEFEIAYRLLPEYWGKGYATELVKALVDWGFTHLEVTKIVAVTHPDNIASQQVLKKTGFIPVGKMLWHTGQEVLRFEMYKSDAIELVPYDPMWPTLATKEIARLKQALPTQHVLDIQHMGSTAIPGLLAKPVIDILIAVDSLAAIKLQAIEALKQLNYVFWDENPDPTRLFFTKGMPPFGHKREANVHIVEPESPHWRDKLQFRDYLLTHPETREAYAQLKQQLEAQYRYDREQYTQSKTTFVQEVLAKARKQAHHDSTPHLIFITGASGVGKTTLLSALQKELKSTTAICLYFDSIGVPDPEEMDALYGSGSEWQKAMTYRWVQRIQRDYHNQRYVILEGQVNLDFITAACLGWNIFHYDIILLRCDNAVRHQRLSTLRQQPELIYSEMDHWAEYLQQQALARHALVLDSGLLSIQEMVEDVKRLLAN